MSFHDRQILYALAKWDFYTFVQLVFAELNPGQPFLENWHVELMAAELMAVYRGEERRVIFNLPPRNLKSIVISVAFVAWVLGHDPTRRFMVISYGQELADKLARDCYRIVTSAWYRAIFPLMMLSAKRQASHDFETSLGGGRMALSRGGAVTGRGAHITILDDPIKADEALSDTARIAANEFVANTLITRPDDKQRDAILVAMQRLHEDDLTGYLLRSERWRHVCLPAIAVADEEWTYSTPFGDKVVRRAAGGALHPEREPLSLLEDLHAIQGDYHFTAQYLQDPLPLSGNLVRMECLRRYETDERPASFDETLFSIDTAAKANQMSDYSVVTHWGRKDHDIYLLAVWRFKATYFQLKTQVRALITDHRPRRILIEDSSAGQQLVQEFKHDGMPGVTGVQAKGDKATRLMEGAILIESGRVFVPSSAPWLADYLRELGGFPHARYDDQVDATSQALNWFRERSREPGLIQFYREEVERALKADEPELPTVAMRPPSSMQRFVDGEGHEHRMDHTTGLILVPERNVALLRSQGWALVVS